MERAPIAHLLRICTFQIKPQSALNQQTRRHSHYPRGQPLPRNAPKCSSPDSFFYFPIDDIEETFKSRAISSELRWSDAITTYHESTRWPRAPKIFFLTSICAPITHYYIEKRQRAATVDNNLMGGPSYYWIHQEKITVLNHRGMETILCCGPV